MSIILAIDPNVLIAATQDHRHCRWFLAELRDRHGEVCVGIDPQSIIYKEYKRHQDLLISTRVTDAFVKLFLERRGGGRLLRLASATLSDEDRALLSGNRCTVPVEPELIAVGKAAPADASVVVLGESFKGAGIRDRGTNHQQHVDALHKEYPTLQIWRASEFGQKFSLIERSRYPGNEEHLVGFLRPVEDEFQEWKQPGKQRGGQSTENYRLTWSIVDRALEAVCAMLNSDGGTVLVGVNSKGQVLGVSPMSGSPNDDPDDDRLSRRFSDRFRWIEPPPNQYVKPAIIPLSNGRRVVVLHVFGDKTDRRYAFDNGIEIAEYDRCGPSNRRKVIGPTRRRPAQRPPWNR